jgi:hypothetical protein
MFLHAPGDRHISCWFAVDCRQVPDMRALKLTRSKAASDTDETVIPADAEIHVSQYLQ